MANKKTIRRPVRVIEDTARYLIRVGGEPPTFFIRFYGDGKPCVTVAPSAAWHGSYREADEIAVKIREQDSRYVTAVTDVYGRLIDYAGLEVERENQRSREAQFWGE